MRNRRIPRPSITPKITDTQRATAGSTLSRVAKYPPMVSDFDDMVRLDCDYIDNWSLWLDMKVLAKTVATVFRGHSW